MSHSTLDSVRPPIPLRCAHLPTQGGLADGRPWGGKLLEPPRRIRLISTPPDSEHDQEGG